MNNFYLTLFALCGFGKNVIATTTNALIGRLERTFEGKPFTFTIHSETQRAINVIVRDVEEDAEFIIHFTIDDNRKIIDIEFAE